MYLFDRLGDIWFPFRRGTVREGSRHLVLATEDPSAYGTSPSKGEEVTYHNFNRYSLFKKTP